MTASEFYKQFKDALAFLLVRWGDMSDVEVYLDGPHVVFSCQGKTCAFRLPEKGKP